MVLLADLVDDPELRTCGGSATHNYASKCFVIQTRAKSMLVVAALLAGFDTVLSDMDVSFVQNPFLYLVRRTSTHAFMRTSKRTTARAQKQWTDVHECGCAVCACAVGAAQPMEHSVEIQLETPTNNDPYCTGFFYSKSDGFALRLHGQSVHRLSALQALDGAMEDQKALNELAGEFHRRQPAFFQSHVLGLDRTLFPNGNSRYGMPDAVLHHNNCQTRTYIHTTQRARRLYQCRGREVRSALNFIAAVLSPCVRAVLRGSEARSYGQSVAVMCERACVKWSRTLLCADVLVCACGLSVSLLVGCALLLMQRQNGFYLYDEAATAAVVSSGAPSKRRLMCSVCERCKSFVPAAPRYRDTFPGEKRAGVRLSDYGSNEPPGMFAVIGKEAQKP